MLTLLVLGTIGSVVGLGIHVWFEPWTSAVVVAIGSFAGMLVSHALGDDLLVGLAAGAGVMMFALGVRALASIFKTLGDPSSIASSSWFAR